MTKIRRSVHRALIAAAVCAVSAAPGEAEMLTKIAVPVPETIRISPELQRHVAVMLQTSPTFRHQFARVVSAPKLIVNARVDLTIVQRSFRARSCIRRYDSGLLIVAMDIGPGSAQAEWIAHEFEHVIEQLEGLRLPALAEHRAPGIWFSNAEMVETTRATRAGRLVMDEMRGSRDRPDKFVD